MLSLIGENALIKSLSEERYTRYGHQTSPKRARQKKIILEYGSIQILYLTYPIPRKILMLTLNSTPATTV